MKKNAALGFLLAAVMVTIALAGCVLPNCTAFLEAGKTEMVHVTADQIVLLWDPPASAVDHYEVYFRVHGTKDWVALGDVAADPQPQFTVSHTALGDGEFDFAVVSVDACEQMSAYHTSLDRTAQPTTGWYVSWYAP